MLNKLNSSGILWDGNLKVAFSLKANAKIIIKKFRGDLPIQNTREIIIDKNLIAVNGANYPDIVLLNDLWVTCRGNALCLPYRMTTRVHPYTFHLGTL